MNVQRIGERKLRRIRRSRRRRRSELRRKGSLGKGGVGMKRRTRRTLSSNMKEVITEFSYHELLCFEILF